MEEETESYSHMLWTISINNFLCDGEYFILSLLENGTYAFLYRTMPFYIELCKPNFIYLFLIKQLNALILLYLMFYAFF